MDTNGAVASLDEGSGLLTIYCNSLSFSYLQWLLATSLKIPATKLTVVPMIAGGSFGSKVFHRKAPILAGFLALASGRPVKYVEDRLAHASSSDHHGLIGATTPAWRSTPTGRCAASTSMWSTTTAPTISSLLAPTATPSPR